MDSITNEIASFMELDSGYGIQQTQCEAAAIEESAPLSAALVTQPQLSSLWTLDGPLFQQNHQQIFDIPSNSLEISRSVQEYVNTLGPQLTPSPLSSPPHQHLCSQGHNHNPWPRRGRLVIEKCERICEFCGVKLKTAAALRKHVFGHQIKDGLEIVVAPSTSGRDRKRLLKSHLAGQLTDAALWPCDGGAVDHDPMMWQAQKLQYPPVTNSGSVSRASDITDFDTEPMTAKEEPRSPAAATPPPVTVEANQQPSPPIQAGHSSRTPPPGREAAISSMMEMSAGLEARLDDMRTFLETKAPEQGCHKTHCDCSAMRDSMNEHISQISSLAKQLRMEITELKGHTEVGTKCSPETSVLAPRRRENLPDYESRSIHDTIGTVNKLPMLPQPVVFKGCKFDIITTRHLKLKLASGEVIAFTAQISKAGLVMACQREQLVSMMTGRRLSSLEC